MGSRVVASHRMMGMLARKAATHRNTRSNVDREAHMLLIGEGNAEIEKTIVVRRLLQSAKVE